MALRRRLIICSVLAAVGLRLASIILAQGFVLEGSLDQMHIEVDFEIHPEDPALPPFFHDGPDEPPKTVSAPVRLRLIKRRISVEVPGSAHASPTHVSENPRPNAGADIRGVRTHLAGRKTLAPALRQVRRTSFPGTERRRSSLLLKYW